MYWHGLELDCRRGFRANRWLGWPARLRVPIYRLNSSALSVACEREGYEPRSVVVEVYNKTKADRYAATSGNGLAGLLVVAAINELSDETKHEFAYPPPRVIMTPRQTAVAAAAKKK